MAEGVYFAVQTPLGVTVRTTKEYWESITTTKHPSIRKYEAQVKKTLSNPDQIRRSTRDSRVHLYYKSIGKLSVCVVADHMSSKEGYVITAYLTDRIKEGEQVYGKEKIDVNN